MTFVVGCLRFFGKLYGQSMTQFAEELKALTKQDRDELTPMLAEVLKTEVTV